MVLQVTHGIEHLPATVAERIRANLSLAQGASDGGIRGLQLGASQGGHHVTLCRLDQRSDQGLRRFGGQLTSTDLASRISGRALAHLGDHTADRLTLLGSRLPHLVHQVPHIGGVESLRQSEPEQARCSQHSALPVAGIRQRLLAQLKLIRQAIDTRLERPTAQQEAAISRRRKSQNDQILQLQRQAHGRRGVDPMA